VITRNGYQASEEAVTLLVGAVKAVRFETYWVAPGRFEPHSCQLYLFFCRLGRAFVALFTFLLFSEMQTTHGHLASVAELSF
jgi:hypothetical protein